MSERKAQLTVTLPEAELIDQLLQRVGDGEVTLDGDVDPHLDRLQARVTAVVAELIGDWGDGPSPAEALTSRRPPIRHARAMVDLKLARELHELAVELDLSAVVARLEVTIVKLEGDGSWAQRSVDVADGKELAELATLRNAHKP